MQLPLSIRPRPGVTLQSQVYDQLRALILEGALRPGQLLPSSRALARALGVSRNTVLLGYDRLAGEGYIQARSGARTFVSAELPDAAIRANARHRPTSDKPRGGKRRARIVLDHRTRKLAAAHRGVAAVDFAVGMPDPESFPWKPWRRQVIRALDTHRRALARYPDPAGYRPLREAVAAHLGATRAISVDADQIVITEGIQEALNLVARLFVAPATGIALENPGYRGLASVFRSYGAKLVPVPVDENGLDVDRLPGSGVSLVCVTPSHQFPTGYTMSLERRLRLLEWAAGSGAYIVEDDYDSDFRYDGPPLTALAGLDAREQVLYLGTFSKSIGAGIRIGYVVLPRELVERAVAVKSNLDNGRSSLEQVALAGFMADGDFERHLRRIRITYRARRDCLLEALRKAFGETSVSGRNGGMHVMWHLPGKLPEARVVEAKALAAGVAVYSLGSGVTWEMKPNRFSRRSLVIGYAAVPEEAIRTGVARIRNAIDPARTR